MEIKFFNIDEERFIQSLETPTVAKILRTMDLLERFGHRIGMPHSKKISGHLFELRIRGIEEVRFLYTYHQKTIIILHGFVKKSQHIPQKELKLAYQRMKMLDAL